MKKYLISGALALVAGAFVASCSDNDFEYTSTVDQKVKEFEKVFKEAFGEIDPNQRWGFEEEDSIDNDINAARAKAKAGTRTIESKHKFSSLETAPSSSVYKTSVPDGVPYLANLTDPWGGHQNYHILQDGASYIITSNVQEWDFSRYPNTLYIEGEITTSTFTVNDKCTIYLTTGSKLKIEGDKPFTSGVKIYVASGASLEVTGKLQLNGAKLYNANVVKAGSLEMINGAYLYNQSTVTLNTDTDLKVTSTSKLFNTGTLTGGKLVVDGGQGLFYNAGTATFAGNASVENGETEIINDATLNITGNLYTRGSGHFMNTGVTTVTGKTDISSNNNSWVNNGKYTTANFYYYGGSNNIINNCNLIVKGDFTINTGSNADYSFQMDTNSHTLTKNFYGGGTKNDLGGSGPFQIIMNSNSLFEVTETALMHNGNSFQKNIIGPSTGSDFAMFYAKNITKPSGTQRNEVSYAGKLYVVATESHFAQGSDCDNQSEDGNFIWMKDGFSVNNIYSGGTNAAGCCAPTKLIGLCTGEGGPVLSTKKKTDEQKTVIETGRVFAEDLGKATREDLDYNDVVFDATIYKVEQIETTTNYEDGVQVGNPSVRVLSTSYEAKITLLAAGGTYPLTIDGQEVHALFGVGTTTIVNTRDNNSTAFGSFATKDPVTFTLKNQYQTISSIPVVVNYGNDASKYGMSGVTKELTAEKGKAPHKIFFPNAYPDWMVERKIITQGYADFKGWVNGTQSKFWGSSNTKDSYYLYSATGHGVTNDPKGTVVNTPGTTEMSAEEVLWTGSETFGSWTSKTVSLNSQVFYENERIRIYGTGSDYTDTLEPPYITIVYSDNSTPYFVDCQFPTTGCIEIKLDEKAAQKLTTGQLTIQGRKFTLSRITINRW